MSVIYLVRHGQAGQNALDNATGGGFEAAYDRLSELGRIQAEATGRALAERTPQGTPVIHGPLVRQRDTAAVIAEALGSPPPCVHDAWREIRFGDILTPWFRERPDIVADLGKARAGLLPRPQVDRVNRELTDAVGRWADGPEFPAFRRRVRAGLQDAARTAADTGALVVVSSGGPIAACVAEMLPGVRWTTLLMTVLNGSVTTIGVTPEAGPGMRLRSLNEHAHLDRQDGKGGHPLRTFG
ncbi:histidine phosphatase family protein [Corynebacterium neomassiliense]|uniref:histidine phosphatase family protein n=1 Tax=Corynebacterium neomassiliense TaxID=2079482 RepID=UPI001386A6B2|nr:histidine phosphatase family protein [Corynebacterium neomassiliense]